MRHGAYVMLVMIISIILVNQSAYSGEPQSANSRKLRNNKIVVQRYFSDIIDRLGTEGLDQDGRDALVEELQATTSELFADDAVQHFPGLPPSRPTDIAVVPRMGLWQRMHTDIHYLVAEDDLVVGYFTHTLEPNFDFPVMAKFSVMMGSPIPVSVPDGTKIVWDAMAFFKLKDGKIVEEWISRDDTGFDLQIGNLSISPF